MRVILRPQRSSDLAVLTGGESPFDDFGPRAPQAAPRPPHLDGPGALTIALAEADANEEDDVAGEVSWHWQKWGPTDGSRCPMIGIWLRAEHRGSGIGTQAQRQMAELFFRHTAVNRVEAHTDVENIAEQRALEAAGYRREGVTRGAQWRDGAYHDGYLYAVIRSDVPLDGAVP